MCFVVGCVVSITEVCVCVHVYTDPCIYIMYLLCQLGMYIRTYNIHTLYMDSDYRTRVVSVFVCVHVYTYNYMYHTLNVLVKFEFCLCFVSIIVVNKFKACLSYLCAVRVKLLRTTDDQYVYTCT